MSPIPKTINVGARHTSPITHYLDLPKICRRCQSWTHRTEDCSRPLCYCCCATAYDTLECKAHTVRKEVVIQKYVNHQGCHCAWYLSWPTRSADPPEECWGFISSSEAPSWQTIPTLQLPSFCPCSTASHYHLECPTSYHGAIQ